MVHFLGGDEILAMDLLFCKVHEGKAHVYLNHTQLLACSPCRDTQQMLSKFWMGEGIGR